MSDLERIPEILKINSFRGKKLLTFERLREISICLSNLGTSVQLPVIKILLECEELSKESSEYKSLVLNSIFDCLRLGLPASRDYYNNIVNATAESDCDPTGRSSKFSVYRKVNLSIIDGIREHIGLILRSIGDGDPKESDSSTLSNITVWTYSIERIGENNARILLCLIENIYPKELKGRKVISIFKQYLDLLEKSVLKDKKHITNICKETLVGLLSSSVTKDYKKEMVLALLVSMALKSTNDNVLDAKSKRCFVLNMFAILTKTGVSCISYFTNALLVETIKHIKSRFNPMNGDEIGLDSKSKYWWRNKTLMLPPLIRELRECVKEQEINKVVIELVYLLNNIDSEYVQAAITQLICDLREKNDKIRLEVVKLVSKFVVLGYGKNHLDDIPQGNETLKIEFSENVPLGMLNNALFDSWVSRLNDKLVDIRNNVLNTLVEVINSFGNREFDFKQLKIVKAIIHCGHISCPNIRENALVSLSNWVTYIRNGNRYCDENDHVIDVINECVQYLLKHISDKSRSIRLFLIGYFKNYKTNEIINSLWLLWYVSFKQDDFQMRSIIEEILIEFNPFKVLESYLEHKKINGDSINKSSTTTYKIVKTFVGQRFELLKDFKLLIILMYIKRSKDNSHKGETVNYCLDALKNKISDKIFYFFPNHEESLKDNRQLMDDIENTLLNDNVLAFWSTLLGLGFSESIHGHINGHALIDELVTSIGNTNKVELKKILSYIHLFKSNDSDNDCENTLLKTILFPSTCLIRDDKESEERELNLESVDEYLIGYVLKLQFRYMINHIFYFINHNTSICSSEEELIGYLDYVIGLYNQLEIYKLYEGYYFVSNLSVLKSKIIKYLSFLNSKPNRINVFNKKMVYDSFSSKYNKKHDFLHEMSRDNNGYNTQIKYISYQIFNKADTYSAEDEMVNYKQMYDHLREKGRKNKRQNVAKHDGEDYVLDTFILFLELDKISESDNKEMKSFILSQLTDKLKKELSESESHIGCKIIEILKLIKAINLLLFRVGDINENHFSDYFDNIHSFFNSHLINGFKACSDYEFHNQYLRNKVLIEYYIRKDECHQQENNNSMQDNTRIFGLGVYFELINNVCFSDLKDFFRKSYLKILDIIQLDCNDRISESKMTMISRLIIPSCGESEKSILTTTLGRSIGIFFIPILSVYAVQTSKLEPSQKLNKDGNLLESILGIFFDSTVGPESIKFEQLYCIIDCVISVFAYYISNSKIHRNDTELLNEVIHMFVKVVYNQLHKKISSKCGCGEKDLSKHIYNIGIYCISLLEELNVNHKIVTCNSKAGGNQALSLVDFCQGLQFHFSYFFVCRDDPEIYRKESTDVFDLWNYTQSTSKFKIPCYLFAKTNNRASSSHDNASSGSNNVIWYVPRTSSKAQGKVAIRRVRKVRKTTKESFRYDMQVNDENKSDNWGSSDDHLTSSDSSEEYRNPKIYKKTESYVNIEPRRSERLKTN